MVPLEGFGWSQPPRHVQHLIPAPLPSSSALAGGKHPLLKGPTMALGSQFLKAPAQTSSLGSAGMPQHSTAPRFALPSQSQPGLGTKSGKILGITWENEGFKRFTNTLNPDPSTDALLLTKDFCGTAQPPAQGVWHGAVPRWHRRC